MRIYNTLTRTIEDFKPLQPGVVKMYCCGPTVYDYTHLGHLFKYIMDDTIARTFRHLGFKVTHVMNITDVGHLVSDEDAGEDKLEKGARKTGKTVWEVAQFYTNFFNHSMNLVGVNTPDIVCKATEHIPEMIDLIKQLETKGYVYDTPEAVYFDTSKFAGYGALTGQKLEDKKSIREDVVEDPNKRNPSDFALWFKRVGRFADHTMHWESPWGDGFPGWHIECSAMSMKYLGPQMDLHTGGIDHVPVHHTNEIAQSEAATGMSPFVKYWVHHNFLRIEGQKMSKSLGNFFTIDDVVKKGFEPGALRLLILQAHYRSEMNFTWDALKATQVAFKRLQNMVTHISRDALPNILTNSAYMEEFDEAISDDFNFAKALGILWEVIKSTLSDASKYAHIRAMNEVLGLDLTGKTQDVIPQEVIALAQQRKEAKDMKDYIKADQLRGDITKMGYTILDEKDGSFQLCKV